LPAESVLDLEETMSYTVEALEAEALNLPLSERARLGYRLIASLDTEPDVDAAWAEEIGRRHAEIESGAVPLIDGAEVFARLKAEFK